MQEENMQTILSDEPNTSIVSPNKKIKLENENELLFLAEALGNLRQQEKKKLQ